MLAGPCQQICTSRCVMECVWLNPFIASSYTGQVVCTMYAAEAEEA